MKSCNDMVPTVYTSEVSKWQSSKRTKMWQKIWQGLYEKHVHIFRLWRKHVQSSKKINIKLYEELCSRGTHCLYIDGEKWLSSQCGKSKKTNLTISSKSHAHPHTMKKTHVKFQNNRYKTVRGVALTSGTNYLYIKGEKWLSSQCGKSQKKKMI